MPLKPQDAPCWMLAYPDGTRAGQWEERHFSDEDEAADTLDCEIGREPGPDDPAPRELAAPCFIVVCDGCGDPYKSDEFAGLIDHFASRADAGWHSGDTEFRDDGTTWCEDCRSWDDERAISACEVIHKV